MIDDLPKEWRDKWYELVPGGRFADAAELKGVCSHPYRLGGEY